MKKWFFGISIFLNVIFTLLFVWNWLNSPTNELGRLEKDIEIGYFQSDNSVFKIPQGDFIYELRFTEFGDRMKNAECKVEIEGNKITIKQTKKTNLTGGDEIFSGLILKHKSGKWILAENEEDINADEIGGCTEIPIIEFEAKIIEWC